MAKNGWIGVDLDRTLAVYHHGIFPNIGEPIPAMVERVKRWRREGWNVKIMTARVNDVAESNYSRQSRFSPYADEAKFSQEQRELIKAWCLEHIGEELPVTNSKDFSMICLYDDRAVGVVPNNGEVVGQEFELREQ